MFCAAFSENMRQMSTRRNKTGVTWQQLAGVKKEKMDSKERGQHKAKEIEIQEEKTLAELLNELNLSSASVMLRLNEKRPYYFFRYALP